MSRRRIRGLVRDIPQYGQLVLPASALFLTGSMLFAERRGLVLPCGRAPGSCAAEMIAAVQRFHSVPLSLLGAIVFFTLLGLAILRCFLRGRALDAAWVAGLALSLLAVLSSLDLAYRSVLIDHLSSVWWSGVWIASGLLATCYAGANRETPPLRPRNLVLASTIFALLATVGACWLSLALVRNTPQLPIDAVALDRMSASALVPSDSVAGGDLASDRILVDISDLQCEYCRAAYQKLKEVSQKQHLKLIMLHYPLAFHKQAELGARLSVMLAKRGRFWEYVERCYTEHYQSDEAFKSAAVELGLSSRQMEADLSRKDPSYFKVHQDMDLVAPLKIAGVPTLILLEPDQPPRLVSLDSFG